MLASANQSHPRTREHDSPVRVEQSSRRSVGVDRLNVANHDIKGAEALSAPIVQGGEADFSIVQANAPQSRVLHGRSAENLRPTRRHLRRIFGLQFGPRHLHRCIGANMRLPMRTSPFPTLLGKLCSRRRRRVSPTAGRQWCPVVSAKPPQEKCRRWGRLRCASRTCRPRGHQRRSQSPGPPKCQRERLRGPVRRARFRDSRRPPHPWRG